MTSRQGGAALMRFVVSVAALLVLIAGGTAAQADPVAIKTGFYSGNEYRQLSQSQKMTYAAGVVDGIFLAPLYGAPKRQLLWLESCIVGITDEQVTAIIDKFMGENPARWHEPMHILAFTALRAACDRSPK